jgi:hypothetical protein
VAGAAPYEERGRSPDKERPAAHQDFPVGGRGSEVVRATGGVADGRLEGAKGRSPRHSASHDRIVIAALG